MWPIVTIGNSVKIVYFVKIENIANVVNIAYIANIADFVNINFFKHCQLNKLNKKFHDNKLNKMYLQTVWNI